MLSCCEQGLEALPGKILEVPMCRCVEILLATKYLLYDCDFLAVIFMLFVDIAARKITGML